MASSLSKSTRSPFKKNLSFLVTHTIPPVLSRNDFPGTAFFPSNNLANGGSNRADSTVGMFSLPNLPDGQPLTVASTCPQRPSSSPCPCCCPTKRSQKFCQPVRLPRLEAPVNPNPFLRPQMASVRHLFSPLTQTIPPLWPPTVSASVPLRGLEALFSNSTVSRPRISSPPGSRTPLTPAGPNRTKDGIG